jgi:hypothetical protein
LPFPYARSFAPWRPKLSEPQHAQHGSAPPAACGSSDLALVATALTTPPARDPAHNNDALEFLGDAVLKMLCHAYLFASERCEARARKKHVGLLREGWLSTHKARLVFPPYPHCSGPGRHEGMLTVFCQRFSANEVSVDAAHVSCSGL